MRSTASVYRLFGPTAKPRGNRLRGCFPGRLVRSSAGEGLSDCQRVRRPLDRYRHTENRNVCCSSSRHTKIPYHCICHRGSCREHSIHRAVDKAARSKSWFGRSQRRPSHTSNHIYRNGPSHFVRRASRNSRREAYRSTLCRLCPWGPLSPSSTFAQTPLGWPWPATLGRALVPHHL